MLNITIAESRTYAPAAPSHRPFLLPASPLSFFVGESSSDMRLLLLGRLDSYLPWVGLVPLCYRQWMQARLPGLPNGILIRVGTRPVRLCCDSPAECDAYAIVRSAGAPDGVRTCPNGHGRREQATKRPGGSD